MKSSYLHKIYQQDKKLFYAIVFFMGMTLFFNFMGDQVMPFFVWGMFSEKEKPKDSYEVYEIKIDGERYDYSKLHLQPSIEIIRESLGYYQSFLSTQDDPSRSFFKEKLKQYYTKVAPVLNRITPSFSQIEQYPKWLKRYLSIKLKRKIKTLEVNILSVQYTSDASLKIIDSKSLFYE